MSEDLGNTSLRVLRGQVLVELVEQRLNRSLQEGDEMQVRPGGAPRGRGALRVTQKWVLTTHTHPPSTPPPDQLWGLVELVEQHLSRWLRQDEGLQVRPGGGWGPGGAPPGWVLTPPPRVPSCRRASTTRCTPSPPTPPATCTSTSTPRRWRSSATSRACGSCTSGCRTAPVSTGTPSPPPTTPPVPPGLTLSPPAAPQPLPPELRPLAGQPVPPGVEADPLLGTFLRQQRRRQQRERQRAAGPAGRLRRFLRRKFYLFRRRSEPRPPLGGEKNFPQPWSAPK